ncbi:BtpA/SgcQ family protein [Neobacillus sp. NPDC058068]|uniref:BtpA/SgcQ family protein n=1 Tax=Neobacillus sp. NPDC058068 TaxID=3346325 RepID=UPI0036D9DB60
MSEKELVAMIALRPLPGTYEYNGESLKEIERQAVEEAIQLKEAGINSIMIQNVNDLPSKREVGHEIIAYMTNIGRAVKDAVGDQCKIGISILKNEGAGSVAVADAIGADYVRLKVYIGAMISSEGITEGCIEEVLEMKKRIGSSVELWADIYDRSGVPLGTMTLEEASQQGVSKGKLDRLIITGKTFDESIEWIKRVKSALPAAKVLLGGSATPENIATVLEVCDGVIIGSYLKKEGVMTNPLDPGRLATFMNAWEQEPCPSSLQG